MEERFHWNKYYILSLIILTLFLGTREGIGVDFYTYKSNFQYGSTIFEFGASEELGQIWLTNILHSLNFDYHSFFLATSFITALLFFNCFKDAYHLLPIGIFVFFLGDMYPFVINGVRQGIALMAFFNVLRLTNWNKDLENKWVNVFWISFYFTLGALFHYSIIIFVPIVFIFNKRFLSLFNSASLILIILLGFVINSISFLDFFLKTIADIFPKYGSYSDLNSGMKEIGNFGLGAILILSLNLIPALFYNRIKKEFPASSKYIVLYAFGTGLMYAYSQYLLIGRLLLYLSLCSVFVYSYMFSYFKKQSNQNPLFLILNISIFSFIAIEFLYVLPKFMEIQIQKSYFSLWFIPLFK